MITECDLISGMMGFLNIAKPAEWTSRDVVNKVQGMVRARKLKAGHAGTLDPMATGVLLVAVGAATRLISYAQGHEKVYRATFRLGITSDTDDITGNVTTVAENIDVSREQLDAVLATFLGTIEQVPPQFSAIHVDGKRAYDLARAGQSVDLKAREIEVHEIRLERFEGNEFVCWIRCGSGTYIRSIGRDVGQILGCGTVMTALERLAIGSCRIEDAVSLEMLSRENIESYLVLAGTLLSHLTRLSIDEEQVGHLEQGRRLPWRLAIKIEPGAEVVLMDGERLAGIGEWSEEMRVVQPKIVFKRGSSM